MSHKLLANLTQIYADPSDNTSCLAKYEGKNCGEKDENYSIEDKKFKIREDFEKVVVDGVRSISVYDQQGISAYDKNSKKIYTTMLDFNVFYFNPEEEKNNETNNSEKKSGLFIGPIEYLNYNNIPNNKYSVEIINEDGSTKIDRNVEGNPNSIKLKFNHVVNAKELLTGKDSDLDLSFLDNLNVDKITKASEVLEVIKDKILDYIDDEKLERGIAIKKVGGTSAVALKAHVNVEEDLIREIYRKVFVDFRNDTNNELNGNKIKIKDNLKVYCPYRHTK